MTNTRTILAALSAAVLLPFAAQAATFATLHSFHNKGQYPYAGVLPVGASLIGTSYGGGSQTAGIGTIYKVSIGGGTTELVLHSFTNTFPEGQHPYASVVKVGPALYGTTQSGGNTECGGQGCGTVFRINANGTNYTTLHVFDSSGGGENPSAGLIEVGGFLYGATQGGGSSGWGTVFKMDTNGNVVWSYAFTGGNGGQTPYGGLVRDGAHLYGTTQGGGAHSLGTVFKIKLDGTGKATMHSFAGTSGGDGAQPESDLVSFGGGLYGITKTGGTSNFGTVFKIDTTNGSGYATVYSFTGTVTGDGAYPFGALVPVFVNAGQPGVLYGSTYGGGGTGSGTLFSLDASGVYANVYSFAGGGDGAVPQGDLSTANGVVYGTTSQAGQYGKGTVFAYTP